MWRKDFVEGNRGLNYEDEEEYMKMYKVMLPYKIDGRVVASIQGEMRGSMTLCDEKGKVLARYSLVNNSTKIVNGKSLGRGNWLAQLLVEYVNGGLML